MHEEGGGGSWDPSWKKINNRPWWGGPTWRKYPSGMCWINNYNKYTNILNFATCFDQFAIILNKLSWYYNCWYQHVLLCTWWLSTFELLEQIIYPIPSLTSPHQDIEICGKSSQIYFPFIVLFYNLCGHSLTMYATGLCKPEANTVSTSSMHPTFAQVQGNWCHSTAFHFLGIKRKWAENDSKKLGCGGCSSIYTCLLEKVELICVTAAVVLWYG